MFPFKSNTKVASWSDLASRSQILIYLIPIFKKVCEVPLQMKKLRHRSVKWLSQGHIAISWWKGNLGPGGVATESMLVPPCYDFAGLLPDPREANPGLGRPGLRSMTCIGSMKGQHVSTPWVNRCCQGGWEPDGGSQVVCGGGAPVTDSPLYHIYGGTSGSPKKETQAGGNT